MTLEDIINAVTQQRVKKTVREGVTYYCVVDALDAILKRRAWPVNLLWNKAKEQLGFHPIDSRISSCLFKSPNGTTHTVDMATFGQICYILSCERSLPSFKEFRENAEIREKAEPFASAVHDMKAVDARNPKRSLRECMAPWTERDAMRFICSMGFTDPNDRTIARQMASRLSKAAVTAMAVELENMAEDYPFIVAKKGETNVFGIRH